MISIYALWSSSSLLCNATTLPRFPIKITVIKLCGGLFLWNRKVLSNWIKFDPIWYNQSHLIHFDLTWTSLNKLDLICSNMIIWANFIWYEPNNQINLIHLDLFRTNLNWFEPIGSNLIWLSDLIWFDLIWTKLFKEMNKWVDWCEIYFGQVLSILDRSDPK